MTPMVVFLHGIGGSSKDWTVENDYTHGHLLFQAVAKSRWLFRCYDLYGHGEWKPDEPDFDPDYINDELWPKFIQESETVILGKVNDAIDEHQVDAVIFVSYSGSAIISLRIANRIDEHVRCMCIMAAPDPARDYDDEYSLHNQINKRSIDHLILYGRDDQEINIGDLQYVYESIGGQKEIMEIDGGHSIDGEWTGIAFQRMFAFGEGKI